MEMSSEQIADLAHILEIKEYDWWCEDTREAMIDSYKRLITLGLGPEEAREFLWNLHAVISEEFGV